MSGGAEKRRHIRIPLIAEIQYFSDSPPLAARISDISSSGLFIDTLNALPIGATVKFRLLLPPEISATPIVGEGVVAWVQPMLGMGLRFTHMGRTDWERITAYVGSVAKAKR